MNSQHLLMCKPGFEKMLRGEVRLHGMTVLSAGTGWGICDAGQTDIRSEPAGSGLCFVHTGLLSATEIVGESGTDLANRLLDHFLGIMKGKRIADFWPLLFMPVIDSAALSKTARKTSEIFQRKGKKILSRVFKLALTNREDRTGSARGFFVCFVDSNRVFVAEELWAGGQRRMRMDAAAPSRSYLKVEEAYRVMGLTPQAGETVVDLGAAPGGWSYSALRHGAAVVGVDNGPMKGLVATHPAFQHLREDAFHYMPPQRSGVDWLFCDMLEQPDRILDLVAQWVGQKQCRKFIVNLKFGRTDPIALLHKIPSPGTGLVRQCRELYVRHLYHDREEITLMGKLF